jgi:hypothetical protein
VKRDFVITFGHYIPPPFVGKGISPLILSLIQKRRSTDIEVKRSIKLLNKISIKCNRKI